MAAELDDLFASPEDGGLSRSSVCSRTRTGSENRTTTSHQPTLLPSPCDRVAAKRGLFLGSVARNGAVAMQPPERTAYGFKSVINAPVPFARITSTVVQASSDVGWSPYLKKECDELHMSAPRLAVDPTIAGFAARAVSFLEQPLTLRSLCGTPECITRDDAVDSGLQ
jgi:hypothetical protein